ncbi:hypothetical protein ACFV6F_17420 [Kitasatospora phosalacinea]|uniref:hypothetical protein n=1 Tax=Kitasatospora phosalacinea TaxID=2065 RepID=UPI0036594C6F
MELEERYRTAGEAGLLVPLLAAELQSQAGDADRDVLGATYKRALVGGGGRKLYDALKAAAPFGCTICGLGKVAELDHHAPKTTFPLLALTPLNLLPVCGPCNRSKSNSFTVDLAEEPFHPYFDDLGTPRWLFAEIHSANGGAVAEFSVRPPDDWPERKAKRLVHHFKNRLANFADETTRPLANRRRRDMRMLDSLGPEQLRAHILEEADSHAAVDPNDWETAWLYGLANCDWYLIGGMKEI